MIKYLFVIHGRKQPVRHSDRYVNEDISRPKANDEVRIAAANIGPSAHSIELAHRIVSLTAAERSSRTSHHFRYRAMLKIAQNELLFTDTDEVFAETSLLDMHERLAKNESVTESVLAEHGKGISAELGHVDQLGDWSAAHALDDEIRSLPESETLERAGFAFSDTYGIKEDAKIGYEFRLVDNSDGKSMSLMGIRKRATADIETTSGHSYEIIKRSTFLLDGLRFEDEKLPFLNQIQRHLRDDEEDSQEERRAAAKARQEIGLALIEPLLTDRELRSRSQNVLAISSLYFALRRH